MNRRFLAFALAFLLGFAQHAALAHAIGHHSPVSHDGQHDRHHGDSAHDTHAHGEPCAQAEHDGHASPDTPDGVHANCALDALYVQVLGGAGAGAVASLPYGALREPVISDDFLSALRAAVLAAAPRGPPAATPPP